MTNKLSIPTIFSLFLNLIDYFTRLPWDRPLTDISLLINLPKMYLLNGPNQTDDDQNPVYMSVFSDSMIVIIFYFTL